MQSSALRVGDRIVMWQAQVFTLFPEMFPGSLGHSIAGKALSKGLWQIDAINIRDFATDKHKTVDDTSYGGGTGMVMRADVVHAALNKRWNKTHKLIYVSPRGTPLTQKKVREFIQKSPDGLAILCGRYEGIDQRLLDYYATNYELEEISVGDYILSGGELASQVIIDSCVRLLPGVLEKPEATTIESFELDLLEHPHYTKPQDWNSLVVPDVLLSGDHKSIAAWRRTQAEMITRNRRQDLWQTHLLNKGGSSI
jgi:tRNA (guanine37-N1)-methyltransferase